MQKLKTFYRTFIKSLTEPTYYNDILPVKFSFSLKYLFLLLFIVSLFGTFRFAFGLFLLKSKLPEFIDKVKNVVMNVYPDKLVITHKSGKISTNVKEPFFIDMPEAGKDWQIGKTHLVAIDTKGKVEEYEEYNSFIFLTDEFAVVPDNQNGASGYKMYPLKDWLKDVPEGAFINKDIYQSLASQTLPYMDKLPSYLTAFTLIVIVFWPLLSSSFALSGHMFYLVFFALILFLIAKIMKKNLTYGKVYQLSMHALTLPILVLTFISLFGKSVPFLFSATFLVFMIVVFTKIPSQEKTI